MGDSTGPPASGQCATSLGGVQTDVHRPTGLVGGRGVDVFEDKSGENIHAAELIRACLLFTP